MKSFEGLTSGADVPSLEQRCRISALGGEDISFDTRSRSRCALSVPCILIHFSPLIDLAKLSKLEAMQQRIHLYFFMVFLFTYTSRSTLLPTEQT